MKSSKYKLTTPSGTSASTNFANISWKTVNVFALDVADERGFVPCCVVAVLAVPDVLPLAHLFFHQLIPVPGQIRVGVVPIHGEATGQSLLLSVMMDCHYWFQFRLGRVENLG